jgi:thiol-disulfide isomerase/thioredoxin
MKKKTIKLVSIAVIAVIFAASAITMAFSPKKDLKPSETKIGTTYELAVKDTKPFIAIFYSDFCGYCVKSIPKYLVIADVYKDKYNIVMMNADKPTEATYKVAKACAVSGLPAMYIIDPSIDNMIFINNALYEDLGKIRVELDRYLRIRSMIKK